MKEWQTNLIGSVIVILFGFVLYGISQSIEIPSAYKTFLGIPYDVNPQYYTAFTQSLGLLLVSLLTIGFGIGIFLNTNSIYRLERKLDNMRVTASTEKKFCQQCGTENKHDAKFCINCGKAF